MSDKGPPPKKEVTDRNEWPRPEWKETNDTQRKQKIMGVYNKLVEAYKKLTDKYPQLERQEARPGFRPMMKTIDLATTTVINQLLNDILS